MAFDLTLPAAAAMAPAATEPATTGAVRSVERAGETGLTAARAAASSPRPIPDAEREPAPAAAAAPPAMARGSRLDGAPTRLASAVVALAMLSRVAPRWCRFQPSSASANTRALG